MSFVYGFSVNIYVIGDKVNYVVLDVYENVFKKLGGILLCNCIEYV